MPKSDVALSAKKSSYFGLYFMEKRVHEISQKIVHKISVTNHQFLSYCRNCDKLDIVLNIGILKFTNYLFQWYA